VAVWNAEPLPFPRESGVRLSPPTPRELAKIVLRDVRTTDPQSNARRIVGLVSRGLVDLVVVTSEDRREYLRERGIDAHVIPRGYHESYGTDVGLERDVDVVFLGALDVPRRRRILRGLAGAGVEVVAHGSWTDQRYWGTGRARLLNRAKVVLSLTRHPGQFAGDRFVVAMGNGALVISEPVYRPSPFRPGEHFVEARVPDLAATIRQYLTHEDARRRIAACGHSFVTQELTMKSSAARLLELLAERLARAKP
jgi:glycosyltransferase involved in cell wall biosynthesis